MTLDEALERLASDTPAPGAGAAAAWACALAAALVEMVAAVGLGRIGDPRAERRRERACELRATALRLADEDAAAYRAVLAAGPEDKHEALAAAADPPLAVAEAAAEAGMLAREALAEATGPVRGEAQAAVALADAATRAAAQLVELDLEHAQEDPRLARARRLAAGS
jgi:formiminotetrahydrofolate cyclodeaminase